MVLIGFLLYAQNIMRQEHGTLPHFEVVVRGPYRESLDFSSFNLTSFGYGPPPTHTEPEPGRFVFERQPLRAWLLILRFTYQPDCATDPVQLNYQLRLRRSKGKHVKPRFFMFDAQSSYFRDERAYSNEHCGALFAMQARDHQGERFWKLTVTIPEGLRSCSQFRYQPFGSLLDPVPLDR